jgi:hypothetical protein
MATPPTDKDIRAVHHLARARLLLDALCEAEVDPKHAACLRIVAAELDQAASVLKGTAAPRHWQRAARVIEFGDGS